MKKTILFILMISISITIAQNRDDINKSIEGKSRTLNNRGNASLLGLSIEEKIKVITGSELPTAPKPIAAYIPAQISGNLVFTSGQLPLKDGKLVSEGKVAESVSVEDAIACARQCAINCLSAVKSVIGNLERIEQIVKLTVFVNSSAGFSSQPKIANGASEFLVQVFGEQGKHARSAVGVSELPLNAPVEIEMIVRLK